MGRKRLATLYDTNNKAHRRTLKPGETLEFPIEYWFDTAADFQINFTLSCATSDGSDSRRYLHLLDISSINAVTFRVNRQTLNELFLVEVLVLNTLPKKNVIIESVNVEPVSMFTCTDLNQLDGPVELESKLTRSYLFQLHFKDKSDPINQQALMAGLVTISWTCGDRFGSVKSDLQQRDPFNSRLVHESSSSSQSIPNIELC